MQNSSRFQHGNRAKGLIRKNFPARLQLLTEFPVRKTETSGTEPARPIPWTYRKIYKGLKGNARSRKLGQPSQPKRYEKALKPLGDVGSQGRLRCSGIKAQRTRIRKIQKGSGFFFRVYCWLRRPHEDF